MSDMRVTVNEQELCEFLLDRNINLERGIIDYINSRFRSSDVLYTEEQRLRDVGKIFR